MGGHLWGWARQAAAPSDSAWDPAPRHTATHMCTPSCCATVCSVCLPTCCPQVDYHSFEGILYAAPLLGALLQHAFRPWNAALLVGGAAAAGRLWPRAQAALRAALGAATADRLVDRVARAWRRQTPRRPWRPLPAPYNPHL